MKFLHDIAKIWSAFVERILYILDPYKKDEEVEYLRMQIQIERNEKMSIIESFTRKPDNDQITDTINHSPINPYIPWRVRRAQLEYEHRIKSDPEGIAIGGIAVGTNQNSKKLKDDIRKLEEELEISNAD